MSDPARSRIAAAVALIGAALSASRCATVPSGSAAIVVASDGRYERLGEGDHLVSPLAQVRVFDLRDEERNEEMSALTADGAELDARAAVVTFHLVRDELEAFAKEVAPDYFEVLVKPVVRSTVRRVLAERDLVALDTEGIRSAQAEVTRLARARLRPHHVELDEVLLKGVILVAPRTDAEIVATAAREQEVLSIPNELELARARAEALRTRARAIEASHALLAPTLAPAVLADEAAKAWGRLLAAPSCHVFIAPSQPSPKLSTVIEVNP